MNQPAKKAAAKKAAAPEPDVSDVRITTKWDSQVNDDTGIRTYAFGDGSTAKAWQTDEGWNVAVADANGRTLSSGLSTGLTVEQANVRLERAGEAADANVAKRKALSDQ